VSEAGPIEGDRWERLPGPLQRLADLGAPAEEPHEALLRRRALNLAAAFIAAAAPLWVLTYALIGNWPAAAIPAIYIVVTGVLLIARSRRAIGDRAFAWTELSMMLVLPFALQWTLGGFAASSMVSLWALTAPLGAIYFSGSRDAMPWFAAFVALAVLSGLIDAELPVPDAEIPDGVGLGFFVLNLVAVSGTVFLLVQYAVRGREAEQRRSERLLLNVLPESVAERLKRTEGSIADGYPEATVLFADIVDFTPLAERVSPEALIELLDRIFTRWDELAIRHGLEKIKTIGDAYMAVAGVPVPQPDHAADAARMALEMVESLDGIDGPGGAPLRVRIGIDTGPLVAGVIGRSKFAFDLWGDTVNTASRMESGGEPGRVQVTDRTRERLGAAFELQRRGEIEIKGKGPITTWFLEREV